MRGEIACSRQLALSRCPLLAASHCRDHAAGAILQLLQTWVCPATCDAAASTSRRPRYCGEAGSAWAAPCRDFRLKNVASINASGHKFGLVYPGVGWCIFRSKKYLPESLVFHDNYLGARRAPARPPARPARQDHT